MATQSTSLSAGTAPNHAWHSTGLWCFATGFSWNRRTLLPQRSTYAWAVRRLAYEACDTGILSSELAAGIRRVKGAKRLGVRIGNWLTIDQARTLLDHSSAEAVRAKRDQAILAVLVGCGLRRAELAGLKAEDFQIREEHWVVADLIGKGKHMRTVPVPGWVKRAIDAWIAWAEISGWTIFRRVNRMGKVWGDGITPKAIWHIVLLNLKFFARRDDSRRHGPQADLAAAGWCGRSSEC